jgi:hypothetical protein
MTTVDSVEFIALTGTSLSSTIVTQILIAADRDLDVMVQKLGSPSISASTLYDAALLFAKAQLVDRYRLDGTFDVSTIDYSHKGSSESIITGYRAEAKAMLQAEARNTITWIQKANR